MIFVWVWLHHVVKGFDPFRTALGQTSLKLQGGLDWDIGFGRHLLQCIGFLGG